MVCRVVSKITSLSLSAVLIASSAWAQTQNQTARITSKSATDAVIISEVARVDASSNEIATRNVSTSNLAASGATNIKDADWLARQRALAATYRTAAPLSLQTQTTTTPQTGAPVGTQTNPQTNQPSTQQPTSPLNTPTQQPTSPTTPAQQQLPPNERAAPLNAPTQQTTPTGNTGTPTPTTGAGATTGTGTTGTPTGAGGTNATGTGAGATGAGIGAGAAGQNVGTSTIAPAQLPSDPPAIAPNYQAPPRPLPSAERVGVDITEQTPMTLNDAIALALQNNNDLEAARIDVRLAEFDLLAARGLYDPRFITETYYERRVNPTASIFLGGPEGSVTRTDLTANTQIAGFTPFGGGSYQFDLSGSRIGTNSIAERLNPQFPTAATLTYIQPLWRGLRFDDNRRRIQIARRNLSLTDSQFRQRAIEIITTVEQAYWDLAFALRNLQVQLDAVKQARIQVESNRRLVEEGVIAPIDLVAADAQVTNFEQNIYAAQELVTRAENILKSRVLPDRTSELWSRALVPVTPVAVAPPTVALEAAVSNALTARPEIAQLQTGVEINTINTRFFREQTRPQIDVVGSFSPAGLAGTQVTQIINPLGNASQTETLRTRVNDIINNLRTNNVPGSNNLTLIEAPAANNNANAIPANLLGGFGQSVGNLFGFDYPTFRVGVRVNIPLRNRTAQAQLGRSLAERTRLDSQRQQLEQLIELDVRNTLQTIRSSEARLASAAASRTSAELQYASEQRRFSAGTSTIFLVLQRQQELVAARGRELQAQIDLNKAVADFGRATGGTLESNNISVVSEKEFRDLRLSPAAMQDVSQELLQGKASRTFSFSLKQTPSVP